MAITVTQLQAQRDALVARLNGISRAKGPDGREIEYRSITEISKAIAVIDEEIGKASGARANRTAYAQHSRGDSFPGGDGSRGRW